MANPDMKLQLIIEAISKTDAAFAALKKDLTTLQTQTAGMAAGGNLAGQSLQDAGKKGAAGMKQVHDHAQNAHSMLGQMVKMAVIFGSLAFAKKLAEYGIDYNKTLETSKLGIGAIMTSMGVISDQQGNILEGQEKWNAGQFLAVEAQRELEKIGMLTAASYTELVEVYQGILAPSLAAKMTFAETLDITGLLTNSVKALGLNINQVKQEARDLIQGGISPASSSLATALGITDSMVKKWREQGTVYDELKSRLYGFTYASKEFSDTWDGAWSNFRDVAQRALGEGSKPLFDFIRKEVVKLTADMTNITRDSSGKIVDIQIKPEAVARIRELAEELTKLIKLLELGVKWGSKLAEPALFLGIAYGITKITTAVKELALAANAGSLARLISSLPALALVAGMWGGKQYADAKHLSAEADGIRIAAKVDNDHESSRLKKSGVNTLANIDEFGYRELASVREKLPSADNTQIATMLRQGIISMQKQTVPGFDKEYRLVVVVDDKKAKDFLQGGKSPFDLKGPETTSEDQAKKQREIARAALEDSYREQLDTVKRGETAKVELIKNALKDKELAFKQGAITETELMKAQAESQKGILQAAIDTASAAQKKLDEEWEAKKGMYDPAERSRAHAAYVSARSKLEEEKLKKTGELKRALTDEEIKQIDHVRTMDAARREGSLKSLQEQLAAEKQLTQLLLDREKISPLEAEKRNLSTEQSGLEAEYWDVSARKMVKGLGDAARIELDAQLQLLEQRMDSLSQQAPNRLYVAGQATSALDAKREEARIAHELAALDELEATRQVGRIEALQQRAALLDDLLASQVAVQTAIDPGDTTAWNTQQAAIDGTRQKLLELQLQVRDLSDDLAGGFREGIEQYVDELGGGFAQMTELARTTAQSMETAFSDFFFDAMQGKLKSLGDYVTAFLSAIQRQMSNILAQQATEGIVSGLGSLFGPSTLSAGGGGGSMGGGTVAVAHAGGLILHDGGKVMAPRFHFGGLASDEVPAVLLKKERVLSIEQNQLFERFANNAKGGSDVQVNVINQTGQQVEAEKSSPRFDGEQLICDVVLKKMKSDPAFRNAMSSGGNQ